MATAKATTNHDEIRKWVEARKGHPARVKATGRGKDPGILRIDFPGFSGEDTLEEIEWDEFFEWFDRNNLALLLSSERGNRFNKLVARPASARKSSAKKSAAKKSSSRRVAGSSSKKASSAKKSSSSTKKSSAGSKSSAKKASSAKKSSGSTKKAATSSKKASSSTKKASSAKKAAPSKKAASSKKSSSKKSTTKSSSTTRRLVASKSPARKSSKKTSSKKASTTGSSRTTTDHDEIRKWVESRGGFPATVAGTETREDEAGVLRIDYPGFTGAGTLERIEWDDWFEKFDEEDLAFVYQNKRNSRFSKLVRR